MLVIKDKTLCSGCSACEKICPKNCIQMIADAEGFLYPKTDEKACVNCGLCEKVCPITNKKNIQNQIAAAYAVFNNDNEVRKKSSSGGIFALLAKTIIEKSGYVFGVGYNEDLTVAHKMVESENQINDLRGSKYVQSDVNETFLKVKQVLEQGSLALFTGTPCQIEGLYSFLGKEYENLITQDVVCHGVSSPLVWKNYLKEQQNKFGAKPIKASFRDKRKSWSEFSMSLTFENGKTYSKTLNKDVMLQAFLNNLCLRPSCYNCKFKQKVHASDITLADFWGIEKVEPSLNDGNGVSLVVINSEKGERLFNELKGNITSKLVSYDQAIKFNSAVLNSVNPPSNRAQFMVMATAGEVKKAHKKYCKKSPIKTMCEAIHKFLYKIKTKLLRG